MSENFRVRLLALSDADAVIALKKEVLNPPFFDSASEQKLFEWKFKNNPSFREDLPCGFVLEGDQGIVGALVLMPARFKVGREVVSACFEVDLMVKPAFRFHGLKLLNKVWQEGPFPVIITTTPNRTSYGIERSLGAKEVLFTKYKFVKLTTPFHFGEKKFVSSIMGLVVWVLNAAVSGALAVLTVWQRLGWREAFTVETLTRFDERFDRFCEEALQNYNAAVVRNSRYLNWRYVDFPFGERVIYAIFGGGKKLRGYAVIQKEQGPSGMSSANILEIFTRKDDKSAVAGLLKLSVAYSEKNKLDYLQIIPCSPGISEMARALGFLKRKQSLPTCLYKVAEKMSRKCSDDPKDWFLSSGDGDTAVYSAIA